VFARLLKFSHRLREEEGSVIILVAVAMTALIGLAALSADVGHIYVERQRLVTIADAAALSGAQYLPYAADTARSAARSYLQKNGYDPALATVTVNEDHRKLNIDLQRTVSLSFARVLGINTYGVTGGVTAWTQNLSGYRGAAPLGVPRADWQVGQQVYLKLDAHTGSVSPGNYQALALGKSGASMYEQNLMTGYQNWIHVNDWVDTETGNMVGPTVRAINYRMSLDPNSTYTTATRQSARIVVVPVLESFDVNGSGQVHVVGFAVFYLEQVNNDSNNSATIIGRFLRFVAEGEGSGTAPDFGAYTTKLIR
jgi:Flp pilus assembly protein TadG